MGQQIISRDFTHNQLPLTFGDTNLEWVSFGKGGFQSALPAEFSISKESKLEMK